MTDRKEEQRSKKHSLATKIILVVIILFIMSLGFSCALDYHNKKTVEEMEEFITEFEKNMNAITEIEDAMKQEEINTLVEEGMMNVNFSTKATFDGKVSKSFNIKNIENNHDSILFEIFDEDGESIYKSKKIAPGYEMNCIELDRELAKGRHECTIEIQYAVEGHVSMVFPIIIEVE